MGLCLFDEPLPNPIKPDNRKLMSTNGSHGPSLHRPEWISEAGDGSPHFLCQLSALIFMSNLATLESTSRRLADAYLHGMKSSAAFAESVLDRLTNSHTAFSTFGELVSGTGDFHPHLQKAPEVYNLLGIVTMTTDGRKITREVYYAELDLLALAYNMAQEARGDNRRAFRS